MFDVFRTSGMMVAAKSAGAVVLATIIGIGAAAADTEVTLENDVGETVLVTVVGTNLTIRENRFNPGSSHVVGKAPAGKTVRWEAKPENSQSKFTICRGQNEVSGAKVTLAMEPDTCSKKPPKTVSTSNQAPKTSTSSTSSSSSSSSQTSSGKMEVSFENKTKYIAELELRDTHGGTAAQSFKLKPNESLKFPATIDGVNNPRPVEVRANVQCKDSSGKDEGHAFSLFFHPEQKIKIVKACEFTW